MDEPGPDLATILREALDRQGHSNRIGVAVSGGGDSMALLALARDWAVQTGASVAVATVDHGLRPESAAEAEDVARICAAWELPHQTLTLTGLEGTANLAARAREARYDALASWVDALKLRPVLLGHTMDDQAETVLMRLGRGSGVEGLSGMPDTMNWRGVAFLRPLLNVRRSRLRGFLAERGIQWVEDPSNDDPAYDRVKARSALTALEPLGISVEGLSATADRLARQRTVLEAESDRLDRSAVTRSDGIVVLDRSHLRQALPDSAMRLIANILMEVGGNAYRPRFRALEPLYRRIVSDEETITTLAKCLIRMRSDRVAVEPERKQQG